MNFIIGLIAGLFLGPIILFIICMLIFAFGEDDFGYDPELKIWRKLRSNEDDIDELLHDLKKEIEQAKVKIKK